jgi:hypothetical protein
VDKLDCILSTFSFSTYLHIRLIIDELSKALSKQWMIVHNDDFFLVFIHEWLAQFVAARIDVFAVDHGFAASVEYGQRKLIHATKSKAGTSWTPGAGLVPHKRKSQNRRHISNLQRSLRIHVKLATRNSRVSSKNVSHFASHWNAETSSVLRRHPAF